METEGILKGFADGSKEGNSAGGNTADCAEVLTTIYAQTAEMMVDGDEIENDAGGSTCETEKVGEEIEEGGLGSRESLTGCTVKDENVVKISTGEEYPYDINWVSGHVQPVGVDMRSTIMANGEGCVKARTLLQRFKESPHVCVDSDMKDSAYNLKGVVQWMCSEWMCEEGDVDMTMQQKGGTYRPADFKKLQGAVAKNWEMFVDGSNDELKSGAAQILMLSRMKDITQTPPEDFRDVPVIVGDGVEYVLLDQLVDFMKKSVDDRNVIHEALHETATKEELVYSDIFNAFTMEKEQCDRGFDEADLSSCFAEYTDNAEEEDEEEDEGVSSSDVEKIDSGPRVCDCGKPFMSLRTLNSHRARACPVVVDERTHGQEMGVVDDAGPSSIGAVNLVSDESEDVGAPENVDGEGGTFEEQQLQPVESFDSSRKLVALIFSARGGVATPAPRNRASGVENRPPKTPEKRSRKDGMSKVHLTTKKRITYKKNRMVEMIDLRGSDDMHSEALEEAEEEHD
ncbi:hypothetical protein CBR_g53831 [Chara braunii]|uniref:Uncharacterized protein n=1 Tax=Chara braunii TaxID=69332 RepID=A0A388K738_CHABU|nr:hypothetical protein CBR_g53831 [Chara braunii]|eukprot:GBG65858.1 hypothetical protein CBR_g53831 [Chara braunii]